MSDEKFPVLIRERDQDKDEYELPAILREAEKDKQESEASPSGSDKEEEESDESDESDEEEDEHAALLTPALDSQIFRTIAAIQKKDPRVYDSSAKFFEQEQIDKANKEWEKQQKELKNSGKKVTLKDYERETLLKHGGYYDEEERIDDEDAPKHLTHNEEQAKIKEEFKMAAVDDDDDDDNDDEEDKGGFLMKKEKSKEEQEAEEEEYKNFLLQNMASDEASSEVFKEWKNYKNNPNMNKDDAFLIDYVLNRGWVEKKHGNQPTYEEDPIPELDDNEADEEYLDQVDRFESKYNFRFEEEGALQIIGHSRNVEGTLRRKESKRKRERERKKAKKEAEKLNKVNELKQLKNQKIKEIQARLEEIRKITGNDDLDLEKIDMEGDFDPDAWDAQMNNVFNEDYYEGEDNEKPVWDDDLGEEFNAEQEAAATSGRGSNNNNDDDDLMMDADYLPDGPSYKKDSKKRKRDGAAEEEEESLPARKRQAQEEYKRLMEEYESLGFEDVIGGDLPTRFKYTHTEPEDFGLTAEEILLADDAELNKYVGLKALAPYRTDEARNKDHRRFKRFEKAKKRDIEKHLDKKLTPKTKSKEKSKEKTKREVCANSVTKLKNKLPA
ncbi:KRI1-like family C-terminal-domain-containing protein [Phycomyces blakesleeanus]|uniref:KRI1-like family C-terminal-domain-containing protein n=1 Tax=Phycomyces blakesleeanus TaxID=4837 RepID=A0ABR3AL04_PHYBL